MTNKEWLRSLTSEETFDWFCSVFKAVYNEDFSEWLLKEHNEEDYE